MVNSLRYIAVFIINVAGAFLISEFELLVLAGIKDVEIKRFVARSKLIKFNLALIY